MLEEIVREYGLMAVFITMTLESALVPIPSEIVVPFAGFLASLGFFSIIEIVFVASFANLLGSIFAYYFGSRIRPFLNHPVILEHIEKAEEFFAEHGLKAVFIGRMLPAVRTLSLIHI